MWLYRLFLLIFPCLFPSTGEAMRMGASTEAELLQALGSIASDKDPCTGLNKLTMIQGGNDKINAAHRNCERAMRGLELILRREGAGVVPPGWCDPCPEMKDPKCQRLGAAGGHWRCSVQVPRTSCSFLFGPTSGKYLRQCLAGLKIPPTEN